MKSFHPTALLCATFIYFSVALLFVLSSVTFRKWRCSTCRKWRLVKTPVTSNVLYQSLWRMWGDNGKRSQATAEGVCGRSCKLQHNWSLGQTWRRGSPHSAQTDRCQCRESKVWLWQIYRYSKFQTGFTASGRAGKLRIHPV